MHKPFLPTNQIPKIFAELSETATHAILPHFRTPLRVDNKLAGANGPNDEARAFDPVTQADRAGEAAMRAVIMTRFPDHGILGEEEGGYQLDADYVWVLDPIDGTRAFISGLPLWGTLIGLFYQGQPLAGAMVQPFLNEIFVGGKDKALFGPAVPRGDTFCQSLSTRPTSALADAIIMTTDPALFNQRERPLYDHLEAACQMHRYGLDCYGYAMVAAGHADLVVEAGLQIYDIAALIPLIEAAGGCVTTWQGDRISGLGQDQSRLQVVASANAALHALALDILQKGPWGDVT